MPCWQFHSEDFVAGETNLAAVLCKRHIVIHQGRDTQTLSVSAIIEDASQLRLLVPALIVDATSGVVEQCRLQVIRKGARTQRDCASWCVPVLRGPTACTNGS